MQGAPPPASLPQAGPNTLSKPARPGALTVAAVLLFIGGLLAILSGLLTLLALSIPLPSVSGALGGVLVAASIVGLPVGALDVWCGVQVLKMRERGRVVGIVLAAIGAAVSLIRGVPAAATVVRSPAITVAGIAVNAVIIWVLARSGRHFTG